MKHVASLELCKALYTRSGWNDTHWCWTSPNPQSAFVGELPKDFAQRNYPLLIPAYDLGYLLRKLPSESWTGFVSVTGQRCQALAFMYGNASKIAECSANTPEDATAMLALALFEQGLLYKEGGRQQQGPLFMSEALRNAVSLLLSPQESEAKKVQTILSLADLLPTLRAEEKQYLRGRLRRILAEDQRDTVEKYTTLLLFLVDDRTVLQEVQTLLLHMSLPPLFEAQIVSILTQIYTHMEQS